MRNQNSAAELWPVKVLIRTTMRRAKSLKHQIQGSKTRIDDEKRGENMMNMSSLK